MFKNITGAHRPDILDCIANLSSDEVFTPPALVNDILDMLPSELWLDPKSTFLDPACKSGVFLREIAKRLMSGLETPIPDEVKRREHIFKKMLFALPTTELTSLMARRTIYCSKDAASEHSIVRFEDSQGNVRFERVEHDYVRGKCQYCGAPENQLDREGMENYAYSFIHKKMVFPMKFDVIIGNPPYQLQDAGGSTGASPIYQHFVNQAIKLNPRYISMIIPSRWFAGGKGLDDFREQMLADRRISHLVDYHDAADCFPGVDIGGGVCYFLWDAKHDGPCAITPVLKGERLKTVKRDLGSYDVFVRFNEAVSILEKVLSKKESPISERMSSRKPFGFQTNFNDFKQKKFPGSVQIYASNKKLGWIDRNNVLQNPQWVSRFKVLISSAYGERGAGPYLVLGTPFIAEPGSCCTETYTIVDHFDNLVEAENLQAYVKTKFFRFLVSIRKISQHNPKDRFEFVPALSTKKKWTDQALYKRYDLNDDEIGFIESMIRDMP